MNKQRVSLLLVAFSCLAFGIALPTPLFSVHPAAGDWTELVENFSPGALEPKIYNLPGGIAELWREGEVFLALLLSCLSLALPVAKLCVVWWEAAGLQHISPAVITIFRASARYAMVEVFLIALMVLVLKNMPGGSRVELHVGTWLFTASVLLSLVATQLASGSKNGPGNNESGVVPTPSLFE